MSRLDWSTVAVAVAAVAVAVAVAVGFTWCGHSGSAVSNTATQPNLDAARVVDSSRADTEPWDATRADDASKQATAVTDSSVPRSIADASRVDASTSVANELLDRYARLGRTTSTEDRFRATVEHAFKNKDFSLECHGSVCHITATDPREFEWANRLQDEAMSAMSAIMVTVGPHGTEIYCEVVPTKDEATTISDALLIGLTNSPAIEECKKSTTAVGSVEIHVGLDATTGKLVFHLSGPLVNSSFGHCVQDAVQGFLQTVPVSASLTSVADPDVMVAVP